MQVESQAGTPAPVGAAEVSASVGTQVRVWAPAPTSTADRAWAADATLLRAATESWLGALSTAASEDKPTWSLSKASAASLPTVAPMAA